MGPSTCVVSYPSEYGAHHEILSEFFEKFAGVAP